MTYDKNSIEFVPLPTHKRFRNRTGQVFGRLTVIGYAGKRGHNQQWFCECACGNITKVMGSGLGTDTRSCGCLQIELTRKRSTTHGQTLNAKWSSEYGIYASAKQRCQDPNCRAYHNYGGRGIEFRFTSFEEFMEAIGPKPTPQHTVDRIDVNGHYEKGNVRWATRQEQGRNQRANRILTVNGVSHCLSEWAEICQMPIRTLSARIADKWCDSCVVLLPRTNKYHGCPHR